MSDVPAKKQRRQGKRRRLRRWVLLSVMVLACLLVGDYYLYPRFAEPRGPSMDRGENGLWLRYTWYFGEKSQAEQRELARRLTERRIKDAYFHVRFIKADGTLRFRYPEEARRLLATVRRHAPQVRLIAWIYAGNGYGEGQVDLSDPAVRAAMVREAQWLVRECGFDGVQWDYEICPDKDPHFLGLLRETRMALPEGTFLSAAVPMWLPRPFGRWGWSSEYFSQVAAQVDQIAVMAYDSGMYLPRSYVWVVGQQAIQVTQAAAKGNPSCRVLIGVPTYWDGGPSHHPSAESLRHALIGVRDGMAHPDADRSVFQGIAVFADYTTQPEEWRTYERLWLRRDSRNL